MQTGTPTLTLSVGYGSRRRFAIGWTLLAGVSLVISCGGCGATVGSYLGRPAPMMLIGFALAAMPALVFVTVKTARVVRERAWLEGTLLTVRGATTATVDIAAARRVDLGVHVPVHAAVARAGGGSRPALVLTVSDGSTTIRLPLQDREGQPLPTTEMQVLADALSTVRCPGAGEAAARIRAVATN